MQNRLIWKKLLPEIETQEIVVITGPRQVGKTTTLHWLLDNITSNNKHYFDLENLIDRELFETKNYDSLIQEFQTRGLSLDQRMYIALDEIQLLPNLPVWLSIYMTTIKLSFFLLAQVHTI